MKVSLHQCNDTAAGIAFGAAHLAQPFAGKAGADFGRGRRQAELGGVGHAGRPLGDAAGASTAALWLAYLDSRGVFAP